jgi:hypothetical protein
MTHGVRPHMARGVCDRKLAFTSYDAAAGKMTEVPGAVRVIRGSCCGMYHITSMTEAEYAQWVAEEMVAQGCTDAASRGMMDLSTEEFLKRWDADHEAQAAGNDRQPGARGSDAGEAAQPCGRGARLAPSPAALARRLQASSSQGR